MSEDPPPAEDKPAPTSKRSKKNDGSAGPNFPPKGQPFPPGGSYGPPGQFPMQPQNGFPNPMWQPGGPQPPYGNQMPWQGQPQMPPQGGPMYRPPGPPGQDRPPENWNGYRGSANGGRGSPKDPNNAGPFPPNGGQRFQQWPGGPQQGGWPQQQWGPGTGPSPQMWQQQGHPIPGAPGQPMMPPKMWAGGNGAGMRPMGGGGGRPRSSPESMPGPFPPAAAMKGMLSGQLCKPVMDGRSVESGDMSRAGNDGGMDENDAGGDGSKKSRAAKERDKARGSYRCGKCGEPKKGHICPYQPKIQRRPDEPPPETRNAAIQVEMDEFMTLRRLNIEIQGLPESYATAGHMAGTMVVGEPHPYSFDEYAALAMSASGLQASPSQIGSFGLQASPSQPLGSVTSFGVQKSPSMTGAPQTNAAPEGVDANGSSEPVGKTSSETQT